MIHFNTDSTALSEWGMPLAKEEILFQQDFSHPTVFAVQLTTVCNNFCSGCANSLLTREKKLRKTNIEYLADWRDLFDRIAPPENRKKYARIIRITGGEPTLHRQFPQIIRYLDSFEIPHVLFTTGRWTVNTPETIIETYRQCRFFAGMLISLHGSEAHSHNAFVESVEGAFEEACANIRLASEAGLDVFANVVITRYNFLQIEKICSLALRLGAKHVVFNRYLGAPHACEPEPSQLRDALSLVETLEAEGYPCHIGNHIPPCFLRTNTRQPKSGRQLCNISPSGLVRPDNFMSPGFGNIFESDIESIWQSPAANAYRNFTPAICTACAALPDCGGSAKSVLLEHGLACDALTQKPLSFYPSVRQTAPLRQIALSDD